MDPLLPEQIRRALQSLTDLADGLHQSLILESVRSGETSGFFALGDDDWKIPYFGKELRDLAKLTLPRLQTHPRACVIIVCDVRCGKTPDSGSHKHPMRIPHAITEAMHGLMHLLEHPFFDAMLTAMPDRLVIVTIDDEQVRIQKDRGRDMIAFVQRIRRVRTTIDEDPQN